MNGNRFELDDADLEQVSGGTGGCGGRDFSDNMKDANSDQAMLLNLGVCPNHGYTEHNSLLTKTSDSEYLYYDCPSCGTKWRVRK